MPYAKPVASFAEIEDEFIGRVHSLVWCTAATVDTRDQAALKGLASGLGG